MWSEVEVVHCKDVSAVWDAFGLGDTLVLPIGDSFVMARVNQRDRYCGVIMGDLSTDCMSYGSHHPSPIQAVRSSHASKVPKVRRNGLASRNWRASVVVGVLAQLPISYQLN